MPRFYQISARWLLALIVTIAATQFPRGTPPQLLSGLFTNADGSPCEQPCLFGVRPEMSYEQALTVLVAHPSIDTHQTDLKQGSRRFDSFAGQAIEVSLSRMLPGYQGVIVSLPPRSDSINGELKSVDPQLQLGEVIIFLGTPEALNVSGDWATLNYFHGRLRIVTRFRMTQPRFFDPRDPVASIILVQAFGVYPFYEERALPWRGFGSVAHLR
jgi:hypothetical protein